jgi:hypothetical protein
VNLPRPPPAYDPNDQAQARVIIEAEDRRNLKTNTIFDAITLRDTVTGSIVKLTVESGAVVIT